MIRVEAFKLKGDGEHVLVARKHPPAMRSRAQHRELLTELGRSGEHERIYPGWPNWLAYTCGPNDDRRIKFAFADAISSFDTEFGAGTLVSETAVERLAPHLVGQAEFYPARMVGAPQPYYLLWVKRVVDALDYENSKLARVDYLNEGNAAPLRIVQAVFKQGKIKDLMLFRLCPGRLSDLSLRDYATENFVNLVKRLKISGFEFYRNSAERPLVPVKLAFPKKQ